MVEVDCSNNSHGSLQYFSVTLTCDKCGLSVMEEAEDDKGQKPKRDNGSNKGDTYGRLCHILPANPGWQLKVTEDGNSWNSYCPKHNK